MENSASSSNLPTTSPNALSQTFGSIENSFYGSRFSLSGLMDPSLLPANFGGSGANLHMDTSLFMKSAEVINQVFPGHQIPGFTPTSNPLSSSSSSPSSSNSNISPIPQTSTQMAIVQFENSTIQKVNEEKPGAFINITPYLTLPQHQAAKNMGIPSSTLSKRWKEASCSRKWPFRTVSKLDKEILTLLKNVESNTTTLAPHIEETLGVLLKRRQEELRTVIIRI